jgi:alpha/beta superfamily hydrolase
VLREFRGPAGRLEALLEEPFDAAQDRPFDNAQGRPAGSPRAAVVFAHPHPLYGGTMHTKVVYRAAKAIQKIGCAVLRFNFRGVGASEGSFGDGAGELEDFRAGLDVMAARYPGVDLWAGGFSFGAWVGLTCGATDGRVSTLIGISPAIEKYDFSEVRRSEKPKFFIQGERDDVAPVGVLRRFYGELPEPKELVVIEDADHLFNGKVLEVGDAIEDLLADFTPVKKV